MNRNFNPTLIIDPSIVESLRVDLEIETPAINAVVDPAFTVNGIASCVFERYNTVSGELSETPANQNIDKVEVRVGDGASFQTAVPTGSGGSWTRWQLSVNSALRGVVTVTVKISAGRGTLRANRSAVRTLMLDNAAPTLSVAANEWTTPSNSVLVQGTASDLESGIDFVEWQLNGGTFVRAEGTTNWQASVTLPGLGDHQVAVRARDKAGHVSGMQTVTVHAVDSTPPVLDIVNPGEGAEFTLQDGTVAVEFQGTASDTQTGVGLVEWRLDEQGEYLPVTPMSSDDWSAWRVTVPMTVAGQRVVSFRATDNSVPSGNAISKTRMVNVLLPFVPKDPGALFSLANYLDELLQFATRRINTAAVNGSAPVSVAMLSQTFLQPFDVLITPNARLIANRSVAQVRICIEVLRRYFARHNRDTPNAAELGYRRAAYQRLLRNLGTSLEELRLVRVADDEVRQLLAARLGIAIGGTRPDNLDRLLLSDEQLNEAAMEGLFGLVDTTRDPALSLVLPIAQLQIWQRDLRRSQWLQQDEAARSDFALPVPVIDPDLILEDELLDALPGNPAYDLWQSRAQALNDRQAALKAAREAQSDLVEGFDRIVADGVAPIADLLALEAEYRQGRAIDSELLARQIGRSAFLQLIRVRRLALAGAVLAEEWDSVYAILTQVWKLRQAAQWRQQEGTLSVSPDFFRLKADPEPNPVLPAWRGNEGDRRRWLSTLAARLQQDQSAGEALQAVLAATEAATLPMLRDGLMADLTQTGKAGLDSVEEIANRLTQELAIDCRASGGLRITRIEQGLETVQAILFSARMGQFGVTPVLGGSNPAADWVLNPAGGYSESKFDDEWQWQGSFASWRAAMAVFAYPENYLQPNLRPLQNLVPNQILTRTAEYDALNAALAGNLKLTDAGARALARDYLEGLRSYNEQGLANYPDLPDALKAVEFQITDQLSNAELQNRARLVADSFGGLDNPYLATRYLWEAFYFVPLAIGLQLQKSGQYLAALDWLQTVYAYNLPTARRKIFYGLVLEANLASDYARSDEWLINGLNPHDIASKRAYAHTRYVLMALIRCFLDFADAEFTRATAESLPRARALYVNALELLDLPEMQAPSAMTGTQPFPANPLPQSLRMHAELNLFKLRNGRNIAGLELAGISAAGNFPQLSADGRLIVAQNAMPKPTPYRYAILVERAKQLIAIAQQIEAAFLAALEKYDAESYSLLRARQDLQSTDAQVKLQNLRETQARDSRKLADLQKQRSTIQAEHYQGLLDVGLIGAEESALSYLKTAKYLQLGAAALYGASAAHEAVKAGLSFGLFGSPASSAAQSLSTLAAAASSQVSLEQTRASYERRKQEWRFSLNLARQDELIGDQQILIARDQIDIAEKESMIASLQAGFAQDTLNFLSNKFTNAELYAWMSGILERVYSYFLQQATAMAQLAESQLAFERQDTLQAIIQADYWQAPADSAATGGSVDRRGLTGSARLLQDIYQLDQYAFDSRRRKLQLSQTFSLAQLSPIEFQRFRDTGRLQFSTTMRLFDQDFPGHYLRLIKRVKISVLALTPPTRGVRATLICSGLSRVVIGGDQFQTVVVRREPEQIAFTSPNNATGLFEMEREDDLLLPFESSGVDTRWELLLPKPANPFDFAGIADVYFTIEYTALASADYRQQVLAALDKEMGAERAFSLRDGFADQWYELNHPEQSASPMIVSFETEAGDFPPHILDLKIQQVVLYFVAEEAESLDLPISYLRFQARGETDFVGGAATATGCVASTRRTNANEWLAMLNKMPAGKWSLALLDSLDDGRTISQLLADGIIKDILLVLTYKGRLPDWP